VVQASGEGAKDAAGEKCIRKKLAAVSVTRELEAEARLLHDGQSGGSVVEEDGGLGAVEMQAVKDRFHLDDVGGVVVEHAGDLKTVDRDFLVGEDADAGACDGFKVLGCVVKLLVVAGGEINAEGRGERSEGLEQTFDVGFCAVKEVTGKEDNIWLETSGCGREALAEMCTINGAEVQIAEQNSAAATPGRGQVREENGDAADAKDAGIEKAIDAGERSEGV